LLLCLSFTTSPLSFVHPPSFPSVPI
jgi:hypothetical protein